MVFTTLLHRSMQVGGAICPMQGSKSHCHVCYMSCVLCRVSCCCLTQRCAHGLGCIRMTCNAHAHATSRLKLDVELPARCVPHTSYHTIPYHTIPYHTIPYHAIPYLPHPCPHTSSLTGTSSPPPPGCITIALQCCIGMASTAHPHLASLLNPPSTPHRRLELCCCCTVMASGTEGPTIPGPSAVGGT